jgi:hypothetical protein
LAASGEQTLVLGIERGDRHDRCYLLVQGCSSASPLDAEVFAPTGLAMSVIGLVAVGLLGGGFMLYVLIQRMREGVRNRNQ